MSESPEEIVGFWFGDALDSAEAAGARVALWFSRDDDFDSEIRRRFGDLPERARRGELDAWRDAPASALALVIVLDQIPRNLHRGSALAFACDERAREVAREALDRGFDDRLHPLHAAFFYLPLEHSEDLADQDRCVERNERLARRAPPELRPHFDGFCHYARRHRELVRRFGRFPHRNAALGREPTPEETAYLESGGETFG